MHDYTILLVALFVLLAVALIVLLGVSWILSEGTRLRAVITAMVAEILDPRRRR